MVRAYATGSTLLALALFAWSGCGSDGGEATPDGGAQAGEWEVLAPIETGPVQETSVVELGGKIYVLGGFHGTRGIVDDLLVYDPVEDSWDTAAPMPQPVHHVNAAALNGKIYVVGALVGNFFNAHGFTWEYDPADDAWTEKTEMPVGSERGASAVGVVDGVIYLAGGFRGGSVADVTSYDPMLDEHDGSPADLDVPLDHLVGAAVGGVFYAIGGRTDAVANVTGRVQAYDPGENAWSERAEMPTARGGMAVGVVGGKIAVVGGEGNPSDPSGVFAESEVYDPSEDVWESLPDMRTPRHGMGAAGLGGKLYVPGGADVELFAAVDTNEALSL